MTEIEKFARLRSARCSADTLYIGGGTPSLLSVDLLGEILNCVRSHFNLDGASEISLEVNPGTISVDKARQYGRMGINRISLGAQSFRDRELAGIGRIHTADQIGESVRALRHCGLNNFNLDLIMGLPEQTWKSWSVTLGQTAKLEPSHISVYMLELEDGTPLFKAAAKGSCVIPNDDQVADWYLRSLELLRSWGYLQYEISNFARPGFECRHNLRYWKKLPYLGFGVGSHSQEGRVRYSNYSNLAIYLRAIENNNSPIAKRKRLTRKAELAEMLFLGLRLNQGVIKEAIEKYFGPQLCAPLWASLGRAEEAGLVEWAGTRMRLTPRGMLLSNEVFQSFVQL